MLKNIPLKIILEHMLKNIPLKEYSRGYAHEYFSEEYAQENSRAYAQEYFSKDYSRVLYITRHDNHNNSITI